MLSRVLLNLSACFIMLLTTICIHFRMAMTSEVQSQLSKSTAVAVGGNLEVAEHSGGSAATMVLRHQISSVSSVEIIASAGLRALIGVQTTR